MTDAKKLLKKMHRQERAFWNTAGELAAYCQRFCKEEIELLSVDGEGYGIGLVDNIDAMIPFHVAIKIIEEKGRLDRADIDMELFKPIN